MPDLTRNQVTRESQSRLLQEQHVSAALLGGFPGLVRSDLPSGTLGGRAAPTAGDGSDTWPTNANLCMDIMVT